MTLHAVLYPFCDCVHHPARFIIFAQLAQLCIIISIFVIFHILHIIRTCKFTQTVLCSIQHLVKSLSWLCCCWSCIFNISHIFLLLHNRCLCVLNLRPCHSGLSIYIILHPFLLLSFATKLCFSSLHPWMLPRLQQSLLQRHIGHHSIDDLVVWIGLWSCQICSPEVENGSSFGALTIGYCVHFLVGLDVGCCMLCTTSRQAVSCMSRLVCFIHLNKAKSEFWLSLHWE